MAWTFTPGAIKETNTVSTSYATDSAASRSGELIFCWIYSEGGTEPDEPSVSGTNGFSATYTKIAGDDDCGSVVQMYAFWALAPSSTAGTITFTFSDNRADNITYGYFFVDGGNTSSAIVANQAGLGDRCAGSGTFSAADKYDNFNTAVRQGNTLSAITDGNAVIVITATNLPTGSISVDSSWTNGVELMDGPASPTTARSGVAYEAGDTNAMTRQMAIAFEVAAALNGGGSEGPVISEGIGVDDVTVSISVDSFPT
jgi:hypothetical protein